MPRRHDDDSRRTPGNPEEVTTRLPEPEPGETPNFESRVSDVGTDPDAMFDENLNPTDEPRRSER
jgi:hypothetical protein